MKLFYPLVIIISCLTSLSCTLQNSTNQSNKYKTTGSIERLDPEINNIIPSGAEIEILACGFTWCEGPLWIEKGDFLIFSDVPQNKIYRWSERDSLSIYLEPSGYTGYANNPKKTGSNGLALTNDEQLLLCQHGDRRLALMNSDVSSPKSDFVTLTDSYFGKKYNSPNDLTFSKNGQVFFTDPPYGLPKVHEHLAEIGFYGVYRFDMDGSVTLLDSTLKRPNGIALSTDNKKLYVANSDEKNAIWKVYDLDEKGNVLSDKIFFDANSMVPTLIGLPDGLKINKKGTIFASGPGGVLIFSPEGKHLGTIKTGKSTANCALNTAENYLFMTAHDCLMRISLQ